MPLPIKPTLEENVGELTKVAKVPTVGFIQLIRPKFELPLLANMKNLSMIDQNPLAFKSKTKRLKCCCCAVVVVGVLVGAVVVLLLWCFSCVRMH